METIGRTSEVRTITVARRQPSRHPRRAAGTSTAQLGGPQSDQSYGFTGWSPETEAEADSYMIGRQRHDQPTRSYVGPAERRT